MYVFFVIQIHTAVLEKLIGKLMLYFLQTFILLFFLVTVVNFSNLAQWGRKLDFCSGNGAAKNSLSRRKKYQTFYHEYKILQVKCTSYSGLSHAETVLQ
jgi:hypothetical protein